MTDELSERTEQCVFVGKKHEDSKPIILVTFLDQIGSEYIWTEVTEEQANELHEYWTQCGQTPFNIKTISNESDQLIRYKLLGRYV